MMPRLLSNINNDGIASRGPAHIPWLRRHGQGAGHWPSAFRGSAHHENVATDGSGL